MEVKESLNFLLWSRYGENKDVATWLREVSLAQRFYNGDQYASANYNNEPRVCLNICSFSANIKASKVCGTPMYIKYSSDNENISCLKLERFDNYNLTKLKHDKEKYQSALNGFNDSIDIGMYRWDEQDTTYKGIYKGGLVFEHIRPKDFAVADISLSEIQNQKWIMYRSFEECGYVRKLCEDKEKAKLIMPDNFSDSEISDEDTINFGQCELYTRFFKVKGEVFFTCSTRTVDLFKFPKALNPKLNKKIAERIKLKPLQPGEEYRDYDMDFEDIMLPYLDAEKWNEEDYVEEKEKFSLYPVAIFVPFVINGKFYGRSDTRQLIPTQQGINFGVNMMLLCAQNNAYQKVIAKEGALQGQVLTNKPGEVIIDHSRYTNGFGIKFAETPQLPNNLIEFTQQLFGMSRTIGGYSDVMDGSISNQDISGYAIQQMIKQSNTTIQQQQIIFWQYQADLAAIRLLFYKFYVEKAKYSYEFSQAEVSKQTNSLMKLKSKQDNGELELGDIKLPDEVKEVVVEDISGEEIYGSNFDIKIEVEQGLVDSKLAESQVWDTLIMNGGIQNLSPEMLEMYLEGNPVITDRTKQALKAIIEKQKHEENAALKGENDVLKSKLQEALAIIQKLTAQNKGLGTYNKNLQSEFSKKIDASNKTIESQNQELSKLLGGVSQGEVKSNNARGINGTTLEQNQ